MTKDVLTIAGEIAGIGGLSLGVFLLLFREVIRKRVFASLTKDQSYKLLRLIVVLTWAIALAGVGSWLLSKALPDGRNSTEGISQSPPTASLERDFPIALGDSRDKVHEILGEPQEIGVAWDAYYSEGLRIYYDIHSWEVDGFYITRMRSGTTYSGAVFGVKMGDSFEHAKNMLGKPAQWGLPDSEFSLAVWKSNNNLLIITFWRVAETARPGEARMGTVHSITYCEEKSFAYYESIIAISIEEIRKGRRPSFLEEGKDPSMDLSDPCFEKPYTILISELFPYGGAYSKVYFHDSKVVLFRIYPLMWVEPRIRDIVEIDGEGNLLLDDEGKPNKSVHRTP